MIRSLHLQNFKSHVDTQLELGRLNVLVGPNAAGKTSVLLALHLHEQLIWDEQGVPFQGYHGIRHLVRRGQNKLLVHVGYDSIDLALQATYSSQTLQGFNLTAYQDERSVGPILESGHWTNGQRYTHRQTVQHTWQKRTGRPAFLQLTPGDLMAPAPMSASPVLSMSGRGLAAVIAEMKLTDSKALDAIVTDLQTIVPQLIALRVHTVDHVTEHNQTEGRMELLVDFEGAPGIPAHAVSEGTLIAIGLMTILHMEQRPKLILLDDIDQSLHPKAQWELIRLLRRFIEQDDELQIVATTHSPYLVDELEPEEVIVTALDDEGVSHCRRLSDHPDAARLREVLSTGEMLSAQGEDWVIQPAS
ncbi:MAG: AAA family ATPase [Bradymonadia bacterium]